MQTTRERRPSSACSLNESKQRLKSGLDELDFAGEFFMNVRQFEQFPA
jgi:hypothetical protein